MKTQDIPININGKFKVPLGVDASEFKQKLLDKVFDSLYDIAEDDINISKFEGEVWSDEGKVSVGKLNFTVGHIEESDTSVVNLTLNEEAEEGREVSAKCFIKSYITPTSAYLMALDPKSMMERELMMISFDDGVLTCFAWDGISSEPKIKTTFPGMVLNAS